MEVTGVLPHAFDLKPYKIKPIAKFLSSLSTVSSHTLHRAELAPGHHPCSQGGPPLLPSYTVEVVPSLASHSCFQSPCISLDILALDSALPVVNKAALSFNYSSTEIFTHLKITLFSI